MTPDPPDPNKIARFLDGSLSDTERQQVIRQLAQSDEALELFALAAEDADGGERRSREWPREERRMARRPWVRTAAAVAAVLAVTVASIAIVERLRANPPMTATDLASRVAGVQLAAALTPGWDQPLWSVSRGSVDTAAEDLSFRLGVRLVDLQVAWEVGDDGTADRLASQVDSLLSGVPESEAARGQLMRIRDRLSRGESATALRRERAIVEANLQVDPAAFDFGKRVEALRLAALAGDTVFLSSAAGREVITALASPTAGPDTRSRVDRVQAIAQDGVTAAELEELQTMLSDIVRLRSE